MANLFHDSPRNLMPSWRSFNTTTALGELNSLEKNKTPKEKYLLDNYINDFKKNKTIAYAADLISAGISNEQATDKYVLEAASFVLKNKTHTTHTQIQLAKKILNPNHNLEETLINEVAELTQFSPSKYYGIIKDIKMKLNKYPYNPILNVELSRYYSIIGEEEKAIRAMKNAIYMAKDNRFVLRSASRLFIHYSSENNDYLQYIRKILNSSNLIKFDTWIMAMEIALSTMLDKSSKHIKKGISLIESNSFSPFDITELCSSIATVELNHGKNKNSRKLFAKSMINPNDNSLAQATWASTIDKMIRIDKFAINKIPSHEALARELYQKKDFTGSFNSIVKWFIDQPFSASAAIFGSFVASTLSKDQEKSIAISKAGLMSNPHNTRLLNNLAYSLALNNKTEEASKEIAKVKSNTLDEDSKICLKATKGLIAFRSGEIKLGRKLYMDAILDSKEADNKHFNWMAILNFAREEILINSENVKYIMEIVDQIPEVKSEIAISILKKDIINMYENLN